jgi:hypothetical protein
VKKYLENAPAHILAVISSCSTALECRFITSECLKNERTGVGANLRTMVEALAFGGSLEPTLVGIHCNILKQNGLRMNVTIR